MAISYSRLNEILLTWAANDPPIEDFTVENILYAANLSDDDYEKVLSYLMSKDGFELIPKKMVLCPSNHKLQSFPLGEPIDGELFDCHICDEIEFEADDFLLVFSFTDDFKDDALKKKKINLQKSKILQLV